MSNNPSFQKTVNQYPAIGVQGQLASQNPAVFALNNPLADADGVTVGAFVWLDSSDNTVSNAGTTSPLGIAVNLLAYGNNDILSGDSMTISEGMATTVLVQGDIFMLAPSAASYGQTVYAKTTDGTLSFDDAGETITGYVETTFKVVQAGASGDIIVISNYN